MMQKIIVVFCMAVFLSSCKSLKEVQFSGVKGFNVQKISVAGIEGDVIIGVKNPNPFGFSIYKSEFDVTYSGIYLGKAKLSKRVFIKRNAEENYNFHLVNDFKYVSILEVLKLIGSTTFKNEMEVKGDINAGRLWMKKKFPVNLKEKVKLQ